MNTENRIRALAGQANSPKEFYDLAVREGFSLGKEQAAAYFESVRSGAAGLSDEEMRSISGGVAQDGLLPKIPLPGRRDRPGVSACGASGD